MIEKYDYIVIGAGIAGLHIGALLSQHGKVLVLEKAKEIGGRARVVDVNGFKLDFGPHPVRFGPISALGASLNEINKTINFIKPGTSWAFLDDGTKTIFPSGGIMAVIKSQLVPTIKTLKFMIKIKKMSVEDFEKLYDLSLLQWFDQENIVPSLQKFLIMASSAIQVNPFPDRSSAGELLHNFSRVLELGSVYYPKGGWTSIFNAFLNKIKDNGGEIRLNEEVNKIIVEDSTAIGVSTKDKLIHGKTIISTIPIQQLFTVLDETLCEKKIIEKCKSLRPTAGVSIDFCLSKPISDINGIIFFDSPLAFGFIPSNLSPEVAPEGKSLMTFFTAANVEDIKDKNTMKEIHQRLRDTILRFFPDLEQYLLHERPLFLEMVDGVEVNIEQHKFKRPGNIIKGIKKLYITGDSVGGSGAGGDIGHESVRNVYKMIRNQNH